MLLLRHHSWCFDWYVTGDVVGGVTGDVTGNVTGNINASSATGISTVGILTAYSSININVGGGSTEIATELKAKASTVRRLQCLWYLVDK